MRRDHSEEGVDPMLQALKREERKVLLVSVLLQCSVMVFCYSTIRKCSVIVFCHGVLL
jgi:hypothetical protein